jgi:hypothetical protein
MMACGRRFPVSCYPPVARAAPICNHRRGSVRCPFSCGSNAHLHEWVMVGADQPVFVNVDEHPIHQSGLVKDYVASLDGRLTLVTQR